MLNATWTDEAGNTFSQHVPATGAAMQSHTDWVCDTFGEETLISYIPVQ